MKKIFTLILLNMIAFNALHAEISWTLSKDGTLTISGTDMPDYWSWQPAPWRGDRVFKVIIENGVTNIGSYAFAGCSYLTSISIPNSVTSIGEYAFSGGCSRLTSITIPNSVTTIGKYVFRNCSGLTSVSLPNTLISIEEGAFAGSGLTSITIPNSVTNIGSFAFGSCESLSSVTISRTVRSIVGDAFSYCYSLNSILVENGNPIYDSRDNCNAIIETQSNTLIVGCQETIIPESVTSIGEHAFDGCTGLVSITIPTSVTNIGKYAFYWCTNLSSITIPAYVTSIEASAFGACSNLISVTLPDGVKSIGNNAFSGCTSLVSIAIPKSVTVIGYNAFSGCTDLTSLTCNAIVPPSCGSDCFSQVNKSIPLYVPEKSIDAYINAKQWNSFANILPIQENSSLTLSLTDEHSDLTKGYYNKGKVTLSRNNMSVGDYTTFCLPFDIDISKTTDNFSKVYQPLNISFLKPSGTLLLLLDEISGSSIIKAGQTFVAKCKTTDVVFENCSDVTFDDSTPNPTPSNLKVYNFDGISGALTQNTDIKIKIGGTYSQLSNTDKNNYRTLSANGSFDSTTSVTPFQMYVYIDDSSLGSKVTSISFDFNDEATGIKELRMNNDKSSVYDLNGRMMNEKNLKPGLYIKNGKKIVIN